MSIINPVAVSLGAFALLTAVFLIGGTIAALRSRKSIEPNADEFDGKELALLRVPAEWLSASVIFNWLDKYLTTASVFGSLAVILLAVYERGGSRSSKSSSLRS